MVTHFSITARKTPRTGKPRRAQSIDSQRVGHNWATKHCTTQQTLSNCQNLWLTFYYLSILNSSQTTLGIDDSGRQTSGSPTNSLNSWVQGCAYRTLQGRNHHTWRWDDNVPFFPLSLWMLLYPKLPTPWQHILLSGKLCTFVTLQVSLNSSGILWARSGWWSVLCSYLLDNLTYIVLADFYKVVRLNNFLQFSTYTITTKL